MSDPTMAEALELIDLLADLVGVDEVHHLVFPDQEDKRAQGTYLAHEVPEHLRPLLSRAVRGGFAEGG